MSKTTAISAIKAYGKAYTDAVNSISKIRNNKELSEDGKAVRIASVVDGFNAKSEKMKADIVSELDSIKCSIDSRRQEAVSKGMASAEQINMIVSGINQSAYSLPMINDIIGTFKGNPVALETIRGALLANDREAYKSAGLEIPMNTDSKVYRNLDSITEQLNHEPPVTTTDRADWNIGLYQSGQTFDSWCDYISENIADE